MKEAKDFESIVESVKSNPRPFPTLYSQQRRGEGAGLQTPQELRQASLPCPQGRHAFHRLSRWYSPFKHDRVDDQELQPGKLNPHEISFEIEPAAEPNGLIPSVVGVGLLILAFAGAVLNLPSFLMLSEQSVYLKVIWRYLIMLAGLVPLMILDFITSDSLIVDLIQDNCVPVFFVSILNTAYIYMVYFAVTQTFVVHTLLLCSIGTTFITTWKIVRKIPFSRLEYIGIGVNVFGAYLCCCEGGVPISSMGDSLLCV